MSSRPKNHDIIDGPSKMALSMALFCSNELKSPTVEFTFEKREGLDDGHFRQSTGGFGGIEERHIIQERLIIQAVKAEDGSNESWIITARSDTHGKVEIYFRTDSREGWIEFLDLE